MEEMKSLDSNRMRNLVDKSKEKRIIGCKWFFERKHGLPGVEPPRCKARLVALGYSQSRMTNPKVIGYCNSDYAGKIGQVQGSLKLASIAG